MISLFKDDDAGYDSWLRANPAGYVVNTYRLPSAAYLMLHRSWCRTISGTPTRGSSWTTKDYSKVCAPFVGELTVWAREELGGTLQSCGTCHPPT